MWEEGKEAGGRKKRRSKRGIERGEEGGRRNTRAGQFCNAIERGLGQGNSLGLFSPVIAF